MTNSRKNKNLIYKLLESFKKTKGKDKLHLLIKGSSGSGKTATLKESCKKLNLTMLTVNSASLTGEGITGNSLSKSLRRVENYKGKLLVIFMDEWDKIFHAESTNKNIQNEVLKLLEPNSTIEVLQAYGNTKELSLSKCLFVFGGVFKDCDTIKELNQVLSPEFMGRVSFQIELDTPTYAELSKALEDSEELKSTCEVFNIPYSNLKSKAKKSLEEFEGNIEDNQLGYRLITKLLQESLKSIFLESL